MGKTLRLQQGQVWQLGEDYIRITRLERLAVEYKLTRTHVARGGQTRNATKKEFCRLIKAAVLLPSLAATPNSPPEE